MTLIALGRSEIRRSARRRLAVAAEPYLYTVPSVFLIALIMLVPLVVGLSYAFRDLTLLDPDSGGFVGLDNFRQLYADASFWSALRNTVTWTVSSVVLQFGLGLVLALLLDRPFRGAASSRPWCSCPGRSRASCRA